MNEPMTTPEESTMRVRSAPSCTASAHYRLLRAFAVLADHGITVRAGVDTDPAVARQELRRAILAEYPHALGSFIFWTAADESAFAADGSLLAPLVLHHSGAEVARSADAALHANGLRARAGAEPDTLQLHPAENATWSVADACSANWSCDLCGPPAPPR